MGRLEKHMEYSLRGWDKRIEDERRRKLLEDRILKIEKIRNGISRDN